MMRFQRSALFLALAAAVAMPVVAADGKPRFDAGFALVTTQLDSAKNITNGSGGFSATGAAYWTTSSDIVIRTGLGFTKLTGSPMSAPGRTDNGISTSLTGVQVYGDLMIPTPAKDLSLVMGLSLNKWSYKSTVPVGQTNPLTGDASTSGSIRGLKFGVRIGAEYTFNSLITGELLLQQTELGSNNPGNIPVGNTSETPYLTNENPGWIQVGVRFHF